MATGSSPVANILDILVLLHRIFEICIKIRKKLQEKVHEKNEQRSNSDGQLSRYSDVRIYTDNKLSGFIRISVSIP